MLTVTSRTHPGAVRSTNEDRVLWEPTLSLLAVADGMGGHNAGEVAARLAIDTIRSFLQESAADDDSAWPFGVNPSCSFDTNRLMTAVKLANQRVFRDAEQCEEYTGMGTTVVAALAPGPHITYVSVGDSRIYLVGETDLQQLSRDDSWVAFLSHESGLDASAFETHPMRHVLTNVVGARLDLDVAAEEFDLVSGQTILLCTDGLYGALSERTMHSILTSEIGLEQAADTMIQAAVDGNCTDNVTVLLARYSSGRVTKRSFDMAIVGSVRTALAAAAAIFCLTASAAGQTNDEVFSQLQWNFSTPGGRASAMGGTFIGMANDAAAAVTNPAGLQAVARPQVHVEYRNADITTNRLASANSWLPGSQSPTAFTTNVNALSFVNVSTPLNNRAAVGFTVHQFLNYQETFQLAPRRIPDIDTNQILDVVAYPVHGSADFKGISYAGTIAYEVTRQVWVGLTLSANVLDAKSSATRFGVAGNALTESSIIVDQTSIDDRKSAIGAAVGVLFRPLEIFWVGFDYTKNPSFNTGESLLRNPGFLSSPCCGTNQTLTAVPGFTNPKPVAINVPDRFGVGLAARPLPNLIVAADFVRVRYSSLVSDFAVILDFAAPGVTADKFTLNDVTEGHVGAEYNVLRGRNPVFVRAGVFTNPTHTVQFTPTIADRALNSSYNAVYNLLPRSREPTGTFGAGVAVGPNLQLDVAYVWKKELVASTAVRF